jgi:peptide/nickel transport system permease protein
MLPQITGLALNLGTIAGGSLITELVFNYPGTGYLLFRALSTLDYPLIQGTFIILISTLLLANFIVDLIYSYIDPRIRTGYASS